SVLAQRGDDQAVKLRAGVAIDPAEVRAAARACGELPGPAGKPRERGLGLAEVAAPRRHRVAGDVMDEAVRVDERVLVRAGHLDAVRDVGDAVTAGGAAHRAALDIVAYAGGRRP